MSFMDVPYTWKRPSDATGFASPNLMAAPLKGSVNQFAEYVLCNVIYFTMHHLTKTNV